MRRVAHRAADVAAQLQRRQASRDCNTAATGRAACRAALVPGIPGRTKNRAVGLKVCAQLRHIGLAQDDRTRRPQPRDEARILRRDVVLQRQVTGRRLQTCDVERLLDGDRDAVQSPQGPTLAVGTVGRPGGPHRAGLVDHHECVERTVHARDPIEMRRRRLDRTQPSVSYGAGKSFGRLKARIHACLP